MVYFHVLQTANEWYNFGPNPTQVYSDKNSSQSLDPNPSQCNRFLEMNFSSNIGCQIADICIWFWFWDLCTYFSMNNDVYLLQVNIKAFQLVISQWLLRLSDLGPCKPGFQKPECDNFRTPCALWQGQDTLEHLLYSEVTKTHQILKNAHVKTAFVQAWVQCFQHRIIPGGD